MNRKLRTANVQGFGRNELGRQRAEREHALLLQRRIVADQRVLVAVGAFVQEAGGWKLSLPADHSPGLANRTGSAGDGPAGASAMDGASQSNPILEGGSFAVLVPTQPWSWVTGAVSMPAALAQALAKRMKSSDSDAPTRPQTRPRRPSLESPKSSDSSALPAGDVAVTDALVTGNFLPAVSGTAGVFALPAFAPAAGKLSTNREFKGPISARDAPGP